MHWTDSVFTWTLSCYRIRLSVLDVYCSFHGSQSNFAAMLVGFLETEYRPLLSWRFVTLQSSRWIVLISRIWPSESENGTENRGFCTTETENHHFWQHFALYWSLNDCFFSLFCLHLCISLLSEYDVCYCCQLPPVLCLQCCKALNCFTRGVF